MQPQGECEVCSVRADSGEPLQQQVAKILKTFGDQGWELVEIVNPVNDVPHLMFKRPKPFVPDAA